MLKRNNIGNKTEHLQIVSVTKWYHFFIYFTVNRDPIFLEMLTFFILIGHTTWHLWQKIIRELCNIAIICQIHVDILIDENKNGITRRIII